MGRAGRRFAPLVLTLACACHRAPVEDGQDIAALRVTCVPVPQGLRCQLLALSPLVARPPRDVTADAVWRFDGPTGTAISKAGMLHAAQGGAIGIMAEFRSQRAYIEAWLAPNAPGEILGTVSGHVYIEQHGALQSLGHVRVEVVAGRNVGRWTTTTADGSYALSRLRPGQGRLRANRPGYTTTEDAVNILLGDNQQNLLMTPEAAPNPRGKAPPTVVATKCCCCPTQS